MLFLVGPGVPLISSTLLRGYRSPNMTDHCREEKEVLLKNPCGLGGYQCCRFGTANTSAGHPDIGCRGPSSCLRGALVTVTMYSHFWDRRATDQRHVSARVLGHCATMRSVATQIQETAASLRNACVLYASASNESPLVHSLDIRVAFLEGS